MALLIILAFSIAGGIWAIHEYWVPIALFCIPTASVCAGVLCANMFGFGAGVALGICMLVGGIIHMFTYDDGCDYYC